MRLSVCTQVSPGLEAKTGHVVKGSEGVYQTLGREWCELLPESLLPSSVPDLQFNRLPTDVDHSGTKLHADGVVGVLFNCSMVAER